MAEQSLSSEDLAVRGVLTSMIAELGIAPSLSQMAARMKLPAADIEASLKRLHKEHALLLHPNETRPWVVHPFALSPSACWVQTPDKGYWASCLYCGLGICAAMECDAVITTRYGGEADTVRYVVKEGAVEPSGDVFHLSIPARSWWDNVVHACATFQPFRNEAEAEDWCVRHDLPRGEFMTISDLWGFAQDWYGSYLTEDWRKRSREEVLALFSRHGLKSDFWNFD